MLAVTCTVSMYCTSTYVSYTMYFLHTVPCIQVGVTVAEVVHIHAVLFQAAGALLNSRQESSPVGPPLSSLVHPPRQRSTVCNNSTNVNVRSTHHDRGVPSVTIALMLMLGPPMMTEEFSL